jgi:cellulose synthase/poly-beta-1,6-N-acetylglucosamine synthase-like glycosyltransferase
MIRVRPECAGAIQKYAEAVTELPVIYHQVQYLGTDRRLTYSLLSQSKKLTTLFVPEAVSETVAPQSLKHYLSQRRRWGSNAYFNTYFYMMGQNMIIPTRIAAFIEILRASMVYYRFCNTILLIKNIAESVSDGTFQTMRIVPLLAVSQLPTIWFAVSMIIEGELRKRAHKLLLGFCINKCVAPFISMTVFFNVARSVGSQGQFRFCSILSVELLLTSIAIVWGISGVTAATASLAAPAPDPALPAVATSAILPTTYINSSSNDP